MPTVTTIVRGNTKEHASNGRDEGDGIDGGLLHVQPPPPPVPPPPMGNSISGIIYIFFYSSMTFTPSIESDHTTYIFVDCR